MHVERIGPNERPLVEAAGIGVHRDGRWLVRDVDLRIARGEIVTLIGPNGGGKTTTARVVLGVLQPDDGRVTRQPNLRIGYVPQRLSIDPTLPLTVRRLITLTERHSRARVDAVLEEVGLSKFADAEVRHLSGGEFQRAMIARAIAGEPDLLVLDEPVQGVDFTGEIALYELIDQVRHRHRTGVLLISHDLHVVMARTDTVICLNGHVCCSGAPRVVAANPEYRRLFGARAAEALAVYRHQHDHEHLPDGSVEPLPYGGDARRTGSGGDA